MPSCRSIDRVEEAVRWALSRPTLRPLMVAHYKTEDTAGDARRFFVSPEFAETLRIVRALLGRRGGRLLDVGAGNGVAAYAFARAGFQVTALDRSAGQLAGLGAAARLQGLNGVRFARVRGDALRLPLRAGAVDVLYARQVLHHLPDLGAFAREARRVLRPGGVLCAVREHVIWNEVQRAHFKAHHPLNHITRDEDALYLREYRAAFAQAGLRLRLELGPYDSVLNAGPEELDALRGLFRGMLRHRGLPAHLADVPPIARWLRERQARRVAEQPDGDQLYSFFAVAPARRP